MFMNILGVPNYSHEAIPTRTSRTKALTVSGVALALLAWIVQVTGVEIPSEITKYTEEAFVAFFSIVLYYLRSAID